MNENILDCLENGAGTCRNEILIEKLISSCEGYKKRAGVLAKELENLRNTKNYNSSIIEENNKLRIALEKITKAYEEKSASQKEVYKIAWNALHEKGSSYEDDNSI